MALGCGSTGNDARAASREDPAVAVDTLPSGALAVRNIREPPVRDLAVAARIGGTSGPPSEQFGHIEAIAVDRLGRVYVGDSQARAVRVFDRAGAFVREFGRPGEGPGEFEEVTGLAWENDSTLWVFDVGNGRYSVFDSAGFALREIRRPPIGVMWPWPGRFDGGDLVEPVVERSRQALGRVRHGGQPGTVTVADTLPDPVAEYAPGERRPAFVLRSPTTIRFVAIPFAPTVQWSLDGHGGVWIGDASDYELVHETLSGDTLLVVSRSWTPVPVSQEERDSVIAELGPPDAVARSFDVGGISESKPAFTLLMVDSNGAIGVLREGMGRSWFWDDFGPDGHLRGVSQLPVWPDRSVLPVVTERSLWLVVEDSLRVQSVVRFDRPDAWVR